MKGSRPCTKFLNVDLDIQAEGDLGELFAKIGSAVIVLNRTDQFVSIELKRGCPTAEETIDEFIKLIVALPAYYRQIWDKTLHRTMNIGVGAGLDPHSVSFPISSETIRRLAEIGCAISFTVYAVAGN